MASRIISPRRQATISPGLPRFAFPFLVCVFLVIFNAANPVRAVLTTCYDPSGGERPDKPCFPDAVASFCCATDWGMLPREPPSPQFANWKCAVCTNTSLCVAGPAVTLNPGDPVSFEGTCTDKTWNSPACPSFCRSGKQIKSSPERIWSGIGELTIWH
jgi:hypothetical protein